MRKLDTILMALINPEVPDLISKKIESAAESFEASSPQIVCHQEFNRHVAEYIQFICKEGLGLPIFLKTKQALSEGISLLDNYYGSLGTGGYEAAYLDAIDDMGKGIGFVRREMAKIIKTIEINRWVDSLFLTTIDPLDKQQRLEVVKALLEKYAGDLPENMKKGNPAQFANYYRQLLELAVSAERLTRSLINHNTDHDVN